jgi:hypothetical protein
MADEKLNTKEIRNEARQLLKQGTSKQETFEILKEKYKYSKDVADILKNLPSQQTIEKYGKWNYVLLGLLVLTALIFFWATPTIGIVLWYGLLIYAVAKMLVKYYIWVTAFSAFAIIGFIAIIFTSDGATTNWSNVIIMISLVIPTLILPMWLEKKLCPKPTERKEEYTNSQGQQRLKIVYEFPDL